MYVVAIIRIIANELNFWKSEVYRRILLCRFVSMVTNLKESWNLNQWDISKIYSFFFNFLVFKKLIVNKIIWHHTTKSEHTLDFATQVLADALICSTKAQNKYIQNISSTTSADSVAGRVTPSNLWNKQSWLCMVCGWLSKIWWVSAFTINSQ